MNNIKIGIVVADNDEFAPLEALIKKGEYTESELFSRLVLRFNLSGKEKTAQITAIYCGIGKVNAAVSTAALISEGCEIILNYGLSGGISKVSRTHICVPSSFIEYDFDLTGIGYKPFEKPNQNYIYNADERLLSVIKEIVGETASGMAVTGDRFVCSAEESAFLRDTLNAVSCDMETAAIAYACSSASVPFAAIRKISDDAGDEAAENYRSMNADVLANPYEIVIKVIEKIIN